MSSILMTAQRWLGIRKMPVSHTEKLVSAVGGLVGILLVDGLSSTLLEGPAAHLMVASMGASAVLLFAAPHGPLSQPWPLLGGHLTGAAVGVACALLPLPQVLNAALAVGLAIGLMHLLYCTHPPGGATALTAVIGGAAVHDLGFRFVIVPVALNVVILLGVAIAFNYPFRWRRYPAVLADAAEIKSEGIARHPPPIDHAHLVAALSEIDSYLDISEHDLLRIYELATQFAEADAHEHPEILPGACYSNGRFGADWEVREVKSVSADGTRVHFKIVAGTNRRQDGSCGLETFQRWAAHQVVRDENSWRPLEPAN